MDIEKRYAKEKELMNREKMIMLEMAELLLQENLITLTEKIRIDKFIKEGKK